jgi:hypothetical protein
MRFAIASACSRRQKRFSAPVARRRASRPWRDRPELFSFSFDRLTQAVGGLLKRAIATGEIRDDITPEDLLCALMGVCCMNDGPGWQTSVLRLVDVFIDGLRVQPDRPRSRTKQGKLE